MNFQNIPRSDKVIKRGFIPKLDAMLFFDYEQIELRLLAYYMAVLGDTSMADAIKAGKDLHTESAIGALGLSEHPTDEQRQVGKTLNFSLVYGGGTPTIMRQLDVSFEDARRLLNNFHSRWPGIAPVQGEIRNHMLMRAFNVSRSQAQDAWFRAVKQRNQRELWDKAVEKKGYITTLWGRHLHPESEHKALNALVQGCAADLMRNALVTADRNLREFDAHLVSVIHDELILDAPFGEIPTMAVMVPQWMDHPPVSEVVPIGTDMEWTTTNWASKEAYKEDLVV